MMWIKYCFWNQVETKSVNYYKFLKTLLNDVFLSRHNVIRISWCDIQHKTFCHFTWRSADVASLEFRRMFAAMDHIVRNNGFSCFCFIRSLSTLIPLQGILQKRTNLMFTMEVIYGAEQRESTALGIQIWTFKDNVSKYTCWIIIFLMHILKKV